MMDGRFHGDLRESIDESADQIGTETVADLPSTEREVRSALPDDLTELLGIEDGTRSPRTVLADSPIGRFLEPPRQ